MSGLEYERRECKDWIGISGNSSAVATSMKEFQGTGIKIDVHCSSYLELKKFLVS